VTGKIDRASRVALKVAWWWFAIGGAGTVVLNGPHQLARLFSYRDPEAAGALSAWVLIGAVLRWTYPLLWPKVTPGELPSPRSTTMPIRFGEKLWTVRRQSAVAAGARALTGDYDLNPQGAGLWLDSDKDDHLFVPMDTSDLPAEAEFKQLTLERFTELYHRAKHK